jgi:hypothetical protein
MKAYLVQLVSFAITADDGDFGAFPEADDKASRQGVQRQCGIGDRFAVDLNRLFCQLAACLGSASGKAKLNEKLWDADLEGARRSCRSNEIGVRDVHLFQIFGWFLLLEHAGPILVRMMCGFFAVKSRNDGARKTLFNFHRMDLAGGNFSLQLVDFGLFEVS